MQFTQPVFLLFGVVFFLGWHLVDPRSRFRLVYLVAASLVFYSWANWRHGLVLIAAGLISYLGALGMVRWPRLRKLVLVAALVASLGLLLAFKIGGLLGISFYILQSLSYLFDVYAGRLQPTRDILHFFSYLALFPKLLSGPIERGKDLLPQLVAPQSASYYQPAESFFPDEKRRWEGTKLIVLGYFSKIVIADNLAPFVDAAFNAPTVHAGAWYWWVAVTAFAIQLYSDFNGYSLIAVGLGKWMGYDLTLNFNHPYGAASLAEFWGRWHITLSNWLRDYIFYPLSRSRWGKGHPHINMWITMSLSGFWHGVGWQFLVWGWLHALYISLERWTQWPNRIKRLRGGAGLAAALVLLQVWVGWVFFRAANVLQAGQILRAMFSFQAGAAWQMEFALVFYLLLGIGWEAARQALRGRSWRLPAWLGDGLQVVGVSLLLVACVLLRGPGSQFIYFQF